MLAVLVAVKEAANRKQMFKEERKSNETNTILHCLHPNAAACVYRY